MKVNILLIAFLYNTVILLSQNYQGKDFNRVFDGNFDGGVMYQYNDLLITVSIVEHPIDFFDQPTKPCEGDLDSSYDGVSPKYYYAKVTVVNNGVYTVNFTHVPTISLYLKDINNPTPHSQCNNFTSSGKNVAFDLRSMGANSSIIFNDRKEGAWFFEKPTISDYKVGAYIIKNPNIKRWPVWPTVDYKTFAKQKGYSVDNKSNEIDDFIRDISDEINTTTTPKNTKNNSKNKKQKKNSNSSSNPNTVGGMNSKSNSQKKVKVYNQGLCRSLKLEATNTSIKMLQFLNSFQNNQNVKYAMSQSSVLTNELKRFSEKYIKAINEKKIAPKCIREINNISDRYAKKYESAVRRMYKKYQLKH